MSSASVTQKCQKETREFGGKTLAVVDTPELKIVLLGKVKAGKTSVMKTLLSSSIQNKTFEDKWTENCEREEVTIGSQKLVIVDTPGLCSAERDNNEIVKEIKKSISHAAPGPHVFLLVLKLGRFTVEEKVMVTTIKQIFGEDVTKHILVLFTHGGDLDPGQTIEDFIKGNDDLSKFVAECQWRHHVIENTDHSRSQRFKLLEKINTMVLENGGSYYKNCKTVLKKKIAVAIGGSAVAGATLGGAIGPNAGNAIGTAVGATTGALAGGPSRNPPTA
ncbi:hypothetical protein L3Q82_013820 [Scortum barcoo]|uniref:Uncharacterized protein n=1 Tax=Scortum barcoo TaxID=214431 RepID=A0ACB8VWP0_9TELE|nr:hypothetical protein L3Q82_013820 [Scortum barcoo]